MAGCEMNFTLVMLSICLLMIVTCMHIRWHIRKLTMPLDKVDICSIHYSTMLSVIHSFMHREID